jgi:hypothetical protein
VSHQICEVCGVPHDDPTYKYSQANLRILISSIPKSGTNLIIQLFGEGRAKHINTSVSVQYDGMPIRKDLGSEKAHVPFGQTCREISAFKGVAFGHIPFRLDFLEAMQAKPTFFILNVRDPRDVIVSHYHWIQERPNALMNWTYLDDTRLSDKSDPIMSLIIAAPLLWQNYLPWLDHAYVMRFENLRTDLRLACRKMLDKVGVQAQTQLNLSEHAMAARVKPTISPTFRKGGIGEWKSHFTAEHREVFNRSMQETMERLGYGLE